MFIDFFFKLKEAQVHVSIEEFLTLLRGLDNGLVSRNVNQFYYFSRTCLVKNEMNLDKFDLVFSEVFRGLEVISEEKNIGIPEQWLFKMSEKYLTQKEKDEIKGLGGFEKLMETLRKRLEEQRKRHQGGNKWVGTGGTSPFGAYGYNPEGIRIGQAGNRQYRAVKIWDKREFRNLDDSIEIGTRNIKMALRRLRKFAREGAEIELDLDNTIKATAIRGWLDIQMMPERNNSTKVLLFFDVGGSMDPYIKVMEELFSAARAEFKNLEYFYFHNFLYERIWKDNTRRQSNTIPTLEIINTYDSNYVIIFVGDASMSPYEISYPGGSVEHWNEEPGAVWFQRLIDNFSRVIWFNPIAEKWWINTQSTGIIREMLNGQMFPLTLVGLETGMRELSRKP